uniref:DNA mismatch repair protein MutS n=1 Tax=Candidatus Methanophagaceae archaeon ANME-1 ERB6 TaxID=2759912 RepID=A0A7G9YX85_9EURY|nr:DNA mismatch repair protein MutS [Methanosarcinales archaeon ANME-1 ERB6]
MPETTPMMQQYYKIKEKHHDAILLFRVGDFYETFGEDAKIAARELNIALTATGRGKGAAKRIPMAGVPFHAVTPYIRQLITKGYKVAICEQVWDKARKDVEAREVVRLITPGTVIEDSFLEERISNYLMCVNMLDGKAGIAIVDVSTGEFLLTELEDDESHSSLLNEIDREKPAEIILPDSLELEHDLERDMGTCTISRYDDYYFDYKTAYTTLINHFGVISLDGFGCAELKAGITAAGAVISYLRDTQKRMLPHIKPPKTFFVSDYMILDSVTVRNLEIFNNIRDGTQRGTLVGVLDKTRTGMGSRRLKKNLQFPLLDTGEIKRREEVVSEFYVDILLRESLKDVFSEVYDVERIISRIAFGNANGKDLVLLKRSLLQISDLQTLLNKCRAEKTKTILKSLRSKDFSAIVNLIERGIIEEPPATIKEGGLLKEGFNAELDDLRKIKHEGRKWLAEFEEHEKARTGIKSLKVGYNRVFGYYIEVRKSWAGKVPETYIRKQTLTEAERYVTEELKDYEAKALSAEERIKELEYELFEQIRKEVGKRAKEIQEAANSVAELDMLLAFAEVAAENGYCCPVVDASDEIVIREGRHPVVEKEVKEGFVPNDVHLDEHNRLMVITGPNMSGKSTFMRQTALIVLMSQLGAFVPAQEAKVGVVDRIFTRVGAYDDLSMGQSSFMVEMSETANILNNATDRSLVILDEIGRGTSTLDGVSIAWSVGEYVNTKLKAKTMFATHFYELTELADALDSTNCFNVSIKEAGDEIFFVRKVVEGRGSKSYGIQVAKLAGLPEEVIESAKGVLKRMESEVVKGGEGRERKEEEEKKVEMKKEYVVQTHPVVDELKSINLEKISPIEALNKLYEMKKRIL